MLFFTISTKLQETLPSYQIRNMEENYSAQNTMARMVDGSGFRYYFIQQVCEQNI
ncbi:MAG: hypothetical protein ACJA1D_000217 [Polaribacter sp.]|jgi:hypothetical protein